MKACVSWEALVGWDDCLFGYTSRPFKVCYGKKEFFERTCSQLLEKVCTSTRLECSTSILCKWVFGCLFVGIHEIPLFLLVSALDDDDDVFVI